MKETTPRIQRIYLRFSYLNDGTVKLHSSLTPPDYDEPLLVLLSRGVMPMGQPFSVLLVSDPTKNEALRGAAGASAYQIAQAAGYAGTEVQWLASLRGKDATTLLGTVTLAEAAALVAVSASTRRLAVTTPSAWGVKVGDDLVVNPVSLSAGFATHDVTVTGPNTISVGITAPRLDVGAGFSFQCRVRRFN